MINPIECLQNKVDDMVNQYERVLNLLHSHAVKGNKYKTAWDDEKKEQLFKINELITEYRFAIKILKEINYEKYK